MQSFNLKLANKTGEVTLEALRDGFTKLIEDKAVDQAIIIYINNEGQGIGNTNMTDAEVLYAIEKAKQIILNNTK